MNSILLVAHISINKSTGESPINLGELIILAAIVYGAITLYKNYKR